MIDVSQVHKTYHSGDLEVKALQGVSLTIGKGEFLSIAGPSGSGKTTLLNLIGCIDTLDQGRILIETQDVSKMDAQALAMFRRNKLGFVFQSFNLIPVLTAYENVALTLQMLNWDEKSIREKTMALFREVGLEGLEDRLPARLSGGQQQRVAVARALVKDPMIVLADEPTANLDSDTGKALLELMGRINSKFGTTFLFSTHDPMVMDFAARLVRLRDGLIISDERRSS